MEVEYVRLRDSKFFCQPAGRVLVVQHPDFYRIVEGNQGAGKPVLMGGKNFREEYGNHHPRTFFFKETGDSPNIIVFHFFCGRPFHYLDFQAQSFKAVPDCQTCSAAGVGEKNIIHFNCKNTLFPRESTFFLMNWKI